MSNPRVAFGIFCDDIRQEVGNKFSFIGTFSGEITVAAKPPVMIPKLGVLVWVLADIDDAPKRATFRVYAPPNKTEITSINVDKTSPVVNFEGATKITVAANWVISPVALMEEGFIEVWAELDDDPPIRASRIKINFVPPPETVAIPASALQPPS